MSEFVPEGWKEGALSEFATINPKLKSDVVLNDDVKVSFIKMEDVSNNAQIKNKRVRNYSEVSKGFTKFNNHDVLVAKITPCFENGKGGYAENLVNGIGFGSTEFHVLRAKTQSDSKYIYQYTNYDSFRLAAEASMCGTGGQRRVQTDFIKTYRTAFPPLPEQQKIATILISVDDVIEKTQAQINKLKDLKTGMMQELLTRGVGVDGKPHAEFKDSPVGRIPKAWEVVKLSEIIGSMDGGVSVNGDNRLKTHKEIGVLKVSSVFKGSFIPHEHKVVIEEDLNRVKINPLKDRILFSRANTPSLVGESGYVERNYDDLYLPDKIWMIDVKDRLKVNVRWLSYILSSGKVRKLICDAATGTSSSMKNISKPNLLSIQVGMPMLEEQKAISDILNLISNKLTLSSTKLEHVKKLKKALMQDLLTGKVRVKVDS
ncbi:restriction endonuclease subunit S [Aliivibrio salmonicida]|uniref:restriction endonuclease subunit S n=1 Tax=Aliivibrio salmonicida TaxID=40269 RepID=UPI003D100F62